MKAPLFVRELTAAERSQLEAGLRSRDAFTLRCCQMLLASAQGQRPSQIARQVGGAASSVRNALHAFQAEGIACLQAKPPGPKHQELALDPARTEELQALLHQSPRTFGKPTSVWSLSLAAEAAWEQGLTSRRLSHETIRQAVKRLGIGWKRAKQWITSPDPADARKKRPAIG
jgi:transposase